MRPLVAFALLTAAALAAPANLSLPDTPSGSDLVEFQRHCQSQQTKIGALEAAGRPAEAAELRAALWESYDAELAARRCQLADASLAVLNAVLPAAERKAAAESLGPAIAALAQLSVFSSPDPADRVRELELSGVQATEAQRSRAETHATLRDIRQRLDRESMAQPEIAQLRRDLVATLTRTAAAKQSLAAHLATAREIPTATATLPELTRKLAEPDLIEELYRRTGESLVLEATLTALIEADPANATFWLARARARKQLGWRAGAVLDLNIAANITRDAAGADTLAQRIRETPASVGAICQEWVDPEQAMEVMRQRRMAEMGELPATALAPALERTARAAVRNQARRLFATSFANNADLRARALSLIATDNPLPPGLFPVIDPSLGAQYEAAIAAAGTDVAHYVAAQQRYAALFGLTEAFWHHQISLLLGTRQSSAALAATEIAGALFTDAAWVHEARRQAGTAHQPPTAGHP